MPFRSVLLAPLVVMALLAGSAGFLLTRSLVPPPDEGAVSVIALPATPTPSPTPSPAASATARVRVRNGQIVDGDRCPAGCTCDLRPNAIVMRCEGE